MKKTIFFFLCFFCFLTINSVEAKTTNLVMEENTNIYYAMYNKEMYRSYPFVRYFQDGTRVYCIDPDKKITTSIYEEVASISTISADKLEKISQIIYFGADYPTHNTVSYELATQALIWEELKDVTVKWYTERYSYGSEIDVSLERQEIETLIKEYQKKPMLTSTSITGSILDHIFIEDFNHVLNAYEIVSFDGGEAIIENDSLKLNLTGEPGNYELLLRRMKYDWSSTRYYVAPNSQIMMKGRIEEEYLKIPVEIVAGEMIVQKKGISLNGEETPLSGVRFELRAGQNFFYQNGELRYGQDELVALLSTDSDGQIKKQLPYGEYYLLESETSENYFLEPNIYYFEIPSSQILEILNYEKNGSLKLYKKDLLTESPLAGIVFLVTNLETKEQKRYQTDENGEILISNLPLGSYEVKEIETLSNYILNEEVKIFELKEHQEVVEYTFYNEKIPEIPDTDAYDFSFLNFLFESGLFYYESKKSHFFH